MDTPAHAQPPGPWDLTGPRDFVPRDFVPLSLWLLELHMAARLAARPGAFDYRTAE